MSFSDLCPRLARMARTSFATPIMKLTTISGVPGYFARSAGSCVATPTGQVFKWHWRAITHPVATIAIVPKPYSSAPNIAAMTISRPERMPPSVRKTTRSRNSFSTSARCVSARPSSQGVPAFLMELSGEAPVPPSCPLT